MQDYENRIEEYYGDAVEEYGNRKYFYKFKKIVFGKIREVENEKQQPCYEKHKIHDGKPLYQKFDMCKMILHFRY
jgi:hypothetical protein